MADPHDDYVDYSDPAMLPYARMLAKFNELGGTAVLGEPDEQTQKAWFFRGGDGGAILDNPAAQEAFFLKRQILKKYRNMDFFQHVSLPTSDTQTTHDGNGLYNQFAHNTWAIYWSTRTEAKSIQGDIYQLWLSMGAERSWLGYPTSDEFDGNEAGLKVSEFENGVIIWYADIGAVALKGFILEYRGLRCFGETDDDSFFTSADEPYFNFAVTTTNSRTETRSQIYGNVDAGEVRTDNQLIHSGDVRSMSINGTLMESDDSTDDDKVGEFHFVLSIKDALILSLQDDRDIEGLTCKVSSPLISGDGASYKAYFSVRLRL